MGFKTEFILILLYAIVFKSTLSAPPISTTESLIVISSEKPVDVVEIKADEAKEKVPTVPKIYSMKVDTNVTNRFAKTLVTSKVKNLDEKPQEATFAVVLPETAYISGFIMEIDGKKYEAYVKEKEEAKQIYNNAVSSGLAAAHVEANARDSNRFTVSVNIEPQSKATFYLTYEELLKRQNGAYDIIINLHPGQPVKDLGVEVNINETKPLSFVKTPSLRSGNEISKNDEKLNPKANIERYNKTAAKVTFAPDLETQKELGSHLGNKEGTGLAGQFVVQYDVERDGQGGEILMSDGYFVHFFAPDELKPLQKHVVFVLDTSGSMSGTRIQQLKQAMKSILNQLSRDDSLNIIDFNSIVNVWNIQEEVIQYIEGDAYANYYGEDQENPPPKNQTYQKLPDSFEATEKNIKHAEKVIEQLYALGGTDIRTSLVVALQLLNSTQSQRSESKQPIVIFLTDGEATVGEYGDQAINSITSANTEGVPIFSLSFGDGADRDFLEKLSLKNQGFARHIYEGADASLQLEEFYKYVSSPLLTKVNFKYVSKAVSKLTKTEFPIMFHGSELVVAGLIDPGFAQQAASTEKPIIIDQGGLVDPSYSFTQSPDDTSRPSVKIVENAKSTTSTPSSEDSSKPIIIDEGGLIDPNFIAPEVDCVGFDGPKHLTPNIGNPVGSLEKHWAYLTLKQLLNERDAAENKTQYTKKALEIALKYSFVTPVSSLVVVKPNDTKAESNPEDASKSQQGPAYDSFAFASAAAPGSVQFMSSGALSSGGYSIHPVSLSLDQYDAIPVDRIYGTKNDEALIVGGVRVETPTPSVQVETLESFKLKLPWLKDILSQNETLDLTNGKYKLGLTANVDIKPDCPSTPLNGTGVCTLLKDCPEIFAQLTDVKVYEKYFCPLTEFAGVCCPKKNNA